MKLGGKTGGDEKFARITYQIIQDQKKERKGRTEATRGGEETRVGEIKYYLNPAQLVMHDST